jgi:hypothetical protein
MGGEGWGLPPFPCQALSPATQTRTLPGIERAAAGVGGWRFRATSCVRLTGELC